MCLRILSDKFVDNDGSVGLTIHEIFGVHPLVGLVGTFIEVRPLDSELKFASHATMTAYFFNIRFNLLGFALGTGLGLGYRLGAVSSSRVGARPRVGRSAGCSYTFSVGTSCSIVGASIWRRSLLTARAMRPSRSVSRCVGC